MYNSWLGMTYLTLPWHFHWSSSCEMLPDTVAAPRKWSAIPPLRPLSNYTLRIKIKQCYSTYSFIHIMLISLYTAWEQHATMQLLICNQIVSKCVNSSSSFIKFKCFYIHTLKKESAELKPITEQSIAQWSLTVDRQKIKTVLGVKEPVSWYLASRSYVSAASVTTEGSTCRPSRPSAA